MKEVTRGEMQKWQGITDFLQYSSLAGLFLMIFILEAVGKETAKNIVWYLAGAMFIYATVGFLVGRKSIKLTSAYFKQDFERIKSKYNL